MMKYFLIFFLVFPVFFPVSAETFSISAEQPFFDLLKEELPSFSAEKGFRIRLLPWKGKAEKDSLFVIAPSAALPEKKHIRLAYAGKVFGVPVTHPAKALTLQTAEKLLNYDLRGKKNEKNFARIRTFERVPAGVKDAACIPDAEILADVVRESVATLGIFPLSVLTRNVKGIRFLAVDGIKPDFGNVISGKYPFVRRTDLIVIREKEAAALIRKMTSRAYMEKLLSAGVIPCTASSSGTR